MDETGPFDPNEILMGKPPQRRVSVRGCFCRYPYFLRKAEQYGKCISHVTSPAEIIY